MILNTLLKIKNLHTYFYTYDGIAKAVDGINFTINTGEILGLVGESGYGKSVTAVSILRLIQDPPGRIVKGEILFDNLNILKLSLEQMQDIRGNSISMIFQEPMTSLNPVYRIGDQIAETIRIHLQASRQEAKDHAIDMLKKVQIPDPEKRIHEYPHQMSGECDNVL
jgi:peptide/nickel transport system ATP-binding protein/oligopeptide transport system ATP-binding protein